MAFIRASALLASLMAISSVSVSATGILLPLYLSPSDWAPALDAMAAFASSPWLAIIQPHPDPSSALDSPDLSQLNALSNVQTIGYVRAAPLEEMQADVTHWATDWATQDTSVDGIFFDKSSATDFAYLSDAVRHARAAFGSKRITTVCNFDSVFVEAEFYRICDVVVAFDGPLTNENPDLVYKGRETFKSNIPAGGYEAQAAVLVHDIPDITLVETYIQEAVEAGLGWVYFCSGSGAYDSLTTAPATVWALAAGF
jgi:hypothetical protein